MMLRTVVVVSALAAAGIGVWKFGSAVNAAPSVEAPVTAVKRGTVAFAITAKGELQGGNTQMLTVPMTGGGQTTITFLRQNGEMVKEGDVVVQLDTTEQEFRLREAESDLAEAEEHIIMAKAEAEAKEEETRYALIQAQADLKLAEIEMRRNELVAAMVARQNELALEAARDRLSKIEKDLKNRLETAKSGIAIQEASRAKAQVKADVARKNIESMTLRAQAAGYVAIQQNDEGMIRWGMYLPPYQVGDIARPGKAAAQIPDLSNWESTARIGELDRGHIAEGQSAEIEVVAMPGRKLQGRIKTVGGTTGPPWDRHFDCRVTVLDPLADLRPGMTVRLRIQTGSIADALWIPAQALFEADGRKFVYVREAGGFSRKDVELVRRSESQVVIKGLEVNQLVALANPDDIAKKKKGSSALEALRAR